MTNEEHLLEGLSQDERVLLRPGPNVRWIISTMTQPAEMPIHLEPGVSYTLRAREEGLDFSKALGENAPTGTHWDLEKYEPVYNGGVWVGTLKVSLVRNTDGQPVSERSVPIYSGPMKCEPPFCEAD